MPGRNAAPPSTGPQMHNIQALLALKGDNFVVIGNGNPADYFSSITMLSESSSMCLVCLVFGLARIKLVDYGTHTVTVYAGFGRASTCSGRW